MIFFPIVIWCLLYLYLAICIFLLVNISVRFSKAYYMLCSFVRKGEHTYYYYKIIIVLHSHLSQVFYIIFYVNMMKVRLRRWSAVGLHELEVNLVCLYSELFDSQCYIVGPYIPPQKKRVLISFLALLQF